MSGNDSELSEGKHPSEEVGESSLISETSETAETEVNRSEEVGTDVVEELGTTSNLEHSCNEETAGVTTILVVPADEDAPTTHQTEDIPQDEK